MMQIYSEKFVIFLWELTYLDVSFTNVLWLWNVFYLELSAYLYRVYDAALWSMYNKGSLRKLSSCYNKCVKSFFFGFKRFDSFTAVLIETGLPSFNTLLYNSNAIFSKCWNTCTLHNKIVGHLSALNNCIWLYFMFAVATISESYLYLHDLCVFCVCFMYILCVYGPSAWNKTDDDDDDDIISYVAYHITYCALSNVYRSIHWRLCG